MYTRTPTSSSISHSFFFFSSRRRHTSLQGDWSSDVCSSDLRQYVEERYGKPFLPETPNVYKSKKDAQDAHEAIRPTSMAFSPEVVEQYLPEEIGRASCRERV